MRTSPEIYGTRAEAQRALRAMADDGRADLGSWPPLPRARAAGYLCKPAIEAKWPRCGARTLTWRRARCRLHRAVNRWDPAGAAQVQSRAAHRRHPPGDHPGTTRAPVGLRQSRTGRTGVPRRHGRPATV